MLGIGQLLERLPRELSGGQRQRVAIGRAIVRDARLFLFDEPLSNLDAQLRDGMRAEIKRLHQELGKTMVYVTHDQIEAMTLADRIVLMQGRRDRAAGRAARPVRAPGHPVRRGLPRLAADELRPLPAGGAALHFSEWPDPAVAASKAARLEPWRGRSMTLGIRPEHFSRADGGAPRAGQVPLRVTVDLVQPTGTRTYATFKLGGAEVSAELPLTRRDPGTELDPGPTSTAPSSIHPQTYRAEERAAACPGFGSPVASRASPVRLLPSFFSAHMPLSLKIMFNVQNQANVAAASGC